MTKPAYRSRKQTDEDAPEPPVYERLPSPLNGHLATFDRHNERIKLFGQEADTLGSPDAQEILERRFENDENYSKLTVYAKAGEEQKWEALGFRKEARIGGFFRTGEDAEIFARYSEDDRAEDTSDDEALKIALEKEQKSSPSLPEGYTSRIADPEDTEAISALLKATFPEYPDDISVQSLKPLIARRAHIYNLIQKDGEIACMAAAQLDRGHSNAEISDCVTAEGHRGNGLMVVAIHELIRYVAHRKGITDFFSMARADIVGINAALARTGFKHDGRLVNNSKICNGLESYNVWWRDARDLA